MNNQCIFCQIVSGQAPSHKIWEDDNHIAFLSIFPNTPGATVVVTKSHLTSCVYQLENVDYQALMLAVKTVCKLLDKAFSDVSRTGMIAEGFGVNHAHIKLFPMHGTAPLEDWIKISSDIETFFDKYTGYLSSHDSKRATDNHLSIVAEQIRRTHQGDK